MGQVWNHRTESYEPREWWGDNEEDNVAWEMQQRMLAEQRELGIKPPNWTPQREDDPRQVRLDALRKEATSLEFVIRDGWATDEQRARRDEAWREVWDIEAEIKAENDVQFAAEWTLEETRRRRREWNNYIRNTIAKLPKRQQFRAVRERENEQGWGFNDLKNAIDLHGIKEEG